MIFSLFVVMTLVEIYVLVTVGEAIGGFSTVLLVVVTALIGSTLLKQQGWSVMAKAQQSIDNDQTPAFEMLEGVVILVSGVLLLTPGFITDAVGLLGLMPWSRGYFIDQFLSKNAQKIFTQKIPSLFTEIDSKIVTRKKPKRTPLKVNFGRIS